MTTGDGGAAPPPGWYPDGTGRERRWDGSGWTADERPIGAPPGPPQGPPQGPPPGAPTGPPPAGPPPGPPSGPPPGRSFAAPGAPYSTPPSKKGLGWLWVVVAAALVIVAIVVTLLVVQPWSDDDGGVTEGGGTTGPSGSPTDSGTGAPTEPAAGPVRGDLDGDGLGDVLGRYYDETESRLTLTNGNGTFQLAQEPVQQEEALVVADFDGDGTSDVGSWFDAAGTLQLEVEDSELAPVTQAFDLWFKVEAVNATFGDFDGDGLTDVAAYGQQHRSQVAVWVLRNTGTGFEQPAKWAALPNATYGSTELIAGDFNGDGRDDLMAVAPNQPLVRGDFDSLYWYGDFGVVPLVAGAGSFARGSIAPVDAELFDQEYAVGDFDGDGKETLVADNYLEDSFSLFEYDGTTLRPTGTQVPYGVSGDGVMDAVAAVDLDGDELDDLVFTSVDIDDYSFLGVWVAVADAAGGIGNPAKWAELPDCTGDFCEVDFFAAS